MKKPAQTAPRLAAAFAGTLAFGAALPAAAEEVFMDQFDFSGDAYTFGSKQWSEPEILTYMLMYALEYAGAEVDDTIRFGSTQINRSGLISGQTDLLFEFLGTGFTVILEMENPPADPVAIYETVKEKDLAASGIHWVGRTGFNDTFAYAVNAAKAEELGTVDLAAMTETLKSDPASTVCIGAEFRTRPDGFILVEKAMDFTVPAEQVVTMEGGTIYMETYKGNCTFGMVFTTDGRNDALDLTIVDMPGVYPIYNISLNMRPETYEAHGKDFEAIMETIFNPIDDAMMTALNAKVVVDGEDSDDVAMDYMIENGFLPEN